jgi:hypothetical protein
MNSPTSTLASFKISVSSCIEKAQYFFSSENFVGGFEILRSSFEENEVSDDTLFSLLKGEIGYNAKDNEVTFGKEFLKSDEAQADYAQEIKEVLSNYDFLIDIQDIKYRVESFFDFDLSLIASTNDWIKELKKSEDTLITQGNFKYFKEISALMEEKGSYHFREASKILYSKGSFYTFKRYDTALITEISTVYKTALEAVVKFREFEDSFNE